MSLLLLALATAVSIPGADAAHLTRPEGQGPFAAVLLIEGWFQPGSWEKETAAALAGEGYLVLAMLPPRERPAGREALHAQMSSPPTPAARAAIEAARAWLLAHPDADGRLAVIGARMGGRDAMAVADLPGVRAAVSWYGTPPGPAPRTPLLAFFGGKDMGPTLSDARAFAERARGTAATVHVYAEAQHGFAEKGNPWGGYDEASARDAWQRALAFLRQHVGPPVLP